MNTTQNIRFALRQLRKSPGFTITAILTLALGIGANTAIFSVMNAVLLRSLPVPDPQQLFYTNVSELPEGTSQTGNDDTSFSMPVYDQLRNQKTVFRDLMAYVPLSTDKTPIRIGDAPEEAHGDMVSGNFFSGLEVSLARGRGFTLDEEKQHAQVAVIGYGFWTRRFSRDPSAIGQTLFVKGVPFTIVGVAPQEFAGVEPGVTTDFWIPLQNRLEITPWGSPGETPYNRDTWWFLMMIARLQPGVSHQQALAQVDPIFQQAARIGLGAPGAKEKRPTLTFAEAKGIEGAKEDYQQPLYVLMAMVGLVLLIACSNVAMLMVARNTQRVREFSLRMALGAGARQIFRQLLTESLLLVGAGVALGWIFAISATRALAAWSDLDVSMAPDRAVLFFTLAISLVAALVFGLAPLRNATRVPAGLVLKTGNATANQDKERASGGRVIICAQLAMCLVLLVAAGLLLRTLKNVSSQNLGMRAPGLLVFGIDPLSHNRTFAEGAQFYEDLLARLRRTPGVESATLMGNRFGGGWSNNTRAFVDGQEPKHAEGGFSPMRWNPLGGDAFHTMGTPLLLGRDFTDADTASAPKVAIVNETFAKRYLGGTNPLGHHMAIDNGPTATQYSIVGVVRDFKYTNSREKPRPMSFVPYRQLEDISPMQVLVRTQGDPMALLPTIGHVVSEIDSNIPLQKPMTLAAQYDQSAGQVRLFARLAAAFGVLAAFLVAVGLYGTLSYRVGRRSIEIGVRMALGAQRTGILWMVLRESLILTTIGIVVGFPLSLLLGRLLQSTLYGLGAHDPLTLAAAAFGVLAVALLATFVPAHTAASVDPMQALRSE